MTLETTTIAVPDLSRYRSDFPVLTRQVLGRSVVYLDSAATSLKPRAVIDALTRFYSEYTANVHRAVHALSEEATEEYEEARAKVARFINADAREVAFTRNATEALNVVAHTVRELGPVAMPASEHHSNLLPWRSGTAVTLPVDADGRVDPARIRARLAETKPALVTFSSVSNALGTVLPVGEMTRWAREIGAYVMLDLSQSVGHEPVDVRGLDCDWAVFSGHKMLGPSGIGVLYQREGVKHPVQPLLIGGSMVHAVHVDDVEYRPFPWCLEAGTPNIEGAIALGAACEYLQGVGLERIHDHGTRLIATACNGLSSLRSVTVLGSEELRSSSIVTFRVGATAAHGVARILSNRFGIMVRSGYHCAQPFHEANKLPETVRASVHLYNTDEEIGRLVEAVGVVAGMN